MKTLFLAVVAAVTLTGSAFALGGINGAGLNMAGINGTSFNSPAVVDLSSLRVLGAVIRH